MKRFWFLIYNLFILPLLYILIRVGSLFSHKIRRGIKGRKRIFEELIINSQRLDRSTKTIWFHSSSLGEFEQAKPIIQKIKVDKKYNIVITFFSPSGYDNSLKYPYADMISYLPFDTRTKAEKFIRIVQPDLFIMMRYDIWPNMIWKLKQENIPSFLVDATMKMNSVRALPIIRSFHKILFGDISKILTVSESDAESFKIFNCKEEQINVVGDTRFDRVYQKSVIAINKKLIQQSILKGKKILVAGSTWEQDEEVILPAFIKLMKYEEDVVLIIAPHEPTLLHLEKIENEFAGLLKTIRFSHLNSYTDERVIIIDSIGILLTLYTYANVAFVGGSFKQNIHNVLEAAVYGIPVMFGPKINNSHEAKELLKRGGGLMVRGKREAYRRMRSLFSDKELREARGKISMEYVQKSIGATDKIIGEIEEVI
ncbi:MAG: 3-deoxy-D-manno-octulosonic acid transferase [Bacteroidetes bacterium]|nr:3-deoxy-D-manno-octulosonic acid transferase [Bacteroidota bacterium]